MRNKNERAAPGGGWGVGAYGRAWEGLFGGGEDYAKGVSGRREWVVPGFLPKGYLVLLGASSKSGKSCFVTALAMAVARGGVFLGVPVNQAPVLWAAYEETEEERMAVLRKWGEMPPQLFTSHRPLRIDEAEGIEALEYWVRRTGAGLVVIDPLYAAVGGDSLTGGRSARRLLTGLKDVCAVTGATVLVLHHLTKDERRVARNRIAESHQLLATASMDLTMEVRSDLEGGRVLTLRGRGRGEFANRVWTIRSRGVTDYEAVAAETLRTTTDLVLEAVRRAEASVTAAQIAEASGVAIGTVRNELTQMVRDGAVVVSGKVGKAWMYCLPRNDSLPVAR